MNRNHRITRPRTKHASFLALAAAILVALSLAASSGADLVKPSVSLGPVTVLNGTATLAGSVKSPAAGTTISVNGSPLSINAGGQFAGVVNLAGQTKLDITVRNPVTGEASTTSIPLNSNIVGPGGVISPEVLANLEQAGVSLLKPLDGFGILDGLPLDLRGGVLDSGKLADLEVNGTGVLDKLNRDGVFSLTVPGTTKEITVSATDRNGVTHTTSYEVRPLSSIVATPSGPSVAAAGAQGLRITSIRHALKGVKKTRRFRTQVVVKDSRGYLVRGATVLIRPLAKKRLRSLPRAVKTGKTGRANFVLRPAKKTFGKRFILQVSAKTPSTKAAKRSYVRLPRLARSARR